ncbi:MAG TPA: CGNR zinc finger domain-containing protein [Plantibacter sp.]|uniref:CGNR zinc finger domain-containing protein n=1 Tax=unclassified Plantibacter TaxID=2624265 RepID=UPI002B792A3E|nr:CGNR zinc finger domain-containing protein [Plantibacter sp.]
MHLAPDTEDALSFAVDLVNTRPTASRSGSDELATTSQLGELLRVSRYSGRVDGDEPERAAITAFRDRLRALWATDAATPGTRDRAVSEINAMLRESAALPQLRRHDGFDWHLHATEFDAPLVDRVQTEIAMALVDVVRSDAWDRLRICAAADCDGLLVDLSRNGSKRYCSVRCSNRVNTIAFRARNVQ